MLISWMACHWWREPWPCWQIHKSHLCLPPNKEVSTSRGIHTEPISNIFIYIYPLQTSSLFLMWATKERWWEWYMTWIEANRLGIIRHCPWQCWQVMGGSPLSTCLPSPSTPSGHRLLNVKAILLPTPSPNAHFSGQWGCDLGAVTKLQPVDQSNLGIIQPFNKGIAMQLIARTYCISLSLVNLMPSHPRSVCFSEMLQLLNCFQITQQSCQMANKTCRPSLIILAINIDKPGFFFLSDLRGGCVSSRVKNLIFWSIQKGTFNLSSYGRERELVTQELFQAVYNLISE